MSQGDANTSEKWYETILKKAKKKRREWRVRNGAIRTDELFGAQRDPKCPLKVIYGDHYSIDCGLNSRDYDRFINAIDGLSPRSPIRKAAERILL